jgi:uncharacterized protein YkwD
MKHLILCFFACLILIKGFSEVLARAEECTDTKVMAIEAYAYLNDFRSMPQTYARRIGLFLPYTQKAKPLHWNYKLAEVAQNKAEDMAKNNYFNHEDSKKKGPNQRVAFAGFKLPSNYLLDSEANNVESLAAGATNGIESINQLISDKGIYPPAHRIHLLALDPFYSDHTEVGIGVACFASSTYKYYYVVITTPKF